MFASYKEMIKLSSVVCRLSVSSVCTEFLPRNPTLWDFFSKMVESWQGSLSCYFQTRNANVIEKKT